MGRIVPALAARGAQAVTVALLVGCLCFALTMALPGDMAMRIAAARYGSDLVTAQAAELVRAELGLDRPWWQQFAGWIADLARFDLGRSLISGEPVLEEIAHQLGHSLWLALAALMLSLLVGPPLGVLFGLRAGSRLDMAGLALAALLRAIPPFVAGIALMLLFGVVLGWLPPAGFGGWREMALPAAALAIGLAAMSSRVTRDAVAGVAAAPYFGFARAKGLTEWQAARRHGLRNAAAPVVAYLAMQLVYLVEGVVIVESLFAYPGIGHALVHAVLDRDVPMLQGTALVMGLAFVVVSALADVARYLLDPRLAAR
jgi:ABC-type dipeptide/oligopeptide/nickel transport system permease component